MVAQIQPPGPAWPGFFLQKKGVVDELHYREILKRIILTAIPLILLMTCIQNPVSGDALDLQNPQVRQAIQYDQASRHDTGRRMYVMSTAYSYTGNPTKTGSMPEDNLTIAVDPKVIPLSSIVVINGSAKVAADTGWLVKGNHIDRYYEDPEEAKDYGVQWIWVTVYPPDTATNN